MEQGKWCMGKEAHGFTDQACNEEFRVLSSQDRDFHDGREGVSWRE